MFCTINPRVVETQEGQADDVFGVGTRKKDEKDKMRREQLK
jgi:hypothetical protein